jgi:hypothetical protein
LIGQAGDEMESHFTAGGPHLQPIYDFFKARSH